MSAFKTTAPRFATCGSRPADGLRIDTNGAGVMNAPLGAQRHRHDQFALPFRV